VACGWPARRGWMLDSRQRGRDVSLGAFEDFCRIGLVRPDELCMEPVQTFDAPALNVSPT
jgi:hypothetical protein